MKAKPNSHPRALTLLAMICAGGPLEARADILWAWSYNNPETKIAASGTLTTKDRTTKDRTTKDRTTKDRVAGSYAIKALTGQWNGAAITGLEAVQSCCSPPGWNSNLLLDGSPRLDKGGFAFSVTGGLKINLFYKNGGYAYEIQNGPEVFGGTFAATPSGAQ